MLTNPDFKELLSLLEKNNCRYLIIGGYAVMKYTEPRFTKDLDILIAADPVNARAIFNTLQEFGAPLENLTARDFSQEGHFYQMGRPPLRIDILMSIPGIKFADAWQHRETDVLDGIQMNFISKQDLITAKKAAGRPIDLIDAENLETS